ncbi:MAG TPA: UbiA family prenyltransferase, partial [candidate division Zixibacteria bacterium]|nr:UbiA family prenyltransferase [candidate division Zixibacteria bacterium]
MNPGEATESVSATAASPYRIRGRSTPLDYLFFMRPVLMPPVWTIALLGTIGRSDNGIPAAWWALFLLQLTCLFGAVYTLNQICDIESDRLNCKLIFLPEGLISVGRARAFTAVLNLVAVGCATLFGWTYVLLSLGVVVLGAVYSVGRQPWKNHPILGLLANTIGHGTLVFLLGCAFSGTLEVADLWHSCAYFFAVGGVYLATTVPDATGDRLSGKRTVAVMIGRGPTMSLATVCVSCAIAIAVYFADTHLLAA